MPEYPIALDLADVPEGDTELFTAADIHAAAKLHIQKNYGDMEEGDDFECFVVEGDMVHEVKLVVTFTITTIKTHSLAELHRKRDHDEQIAANDDAPNGYH